MPEPQFSAPPARPPAAAVTWGGLLATAAVLLLILGSATALGAWWAWRHLAVQVALGEQQAMVRLPSSLAVRAAMTNQVQVRVDEVVPVKVPVSQDLTIPVEGPLQVQVAIDTVVPVDLTVPVRHVVRIDQPIEIDTTVKTRVLGFPLTLPVRGTVPLKTDIPIAMDIPVRHQLPVALSVPATVRLAEPLRTRIDTTFEAKVPVRQVLMLPVNAPLDATLTFPTQVVAAGVDAMDVTVPFGALTLSRLDKAARHPGGQAQEGAQPPAGSAGGDKGASAEGARGGDGSASGPDRRKAPTAGAPRP